jgi:hypothetical protein
MKLKTEIRHIGRRSFPAADFWQNFISPFEVGAGLVSSTPEAPIGLAIHVGGFL